MMMTIKDKRKLNEIESIFNVYFTFECKSQLDLV